jgi:hypothetical protein
VFRQNVELLQTIQTLAQFCFAKANPFLPAGEMTHRLKDLSRQITFAGQSFKSGKFTFKTAQVRAAVSNQVEQGPHQEITLRSGTVSSPLRTGSADPLRSQDVPDLLKDLPGQAPALFAFPKALLNVHMFIGTYILS